MNRTKFSYLKWTPIAAGLAIAVLLSMPSSKATNQPAAVVADLANEERIIAKYADDLAAYDQQAAELGKRARLVNADIEAIERRSNDLESRLSSVQSAAADIIKKLKAANEWDALDSTLLTKITDARRRSFFQESSLKQLLEESASSLNSRRNEIAVPLENLRKKLVSRYGEGADFQLVRAGYRAAIPNPVMIKSTRCMLAGMRYGISGFIHGPEATKRSETGVDCYCFGMASACAAL
jgi:septal ring factor EnvC (AmiA/AmiB activator)